MSEWQTIDTAPLDGTRVYVANERASSSMKRGTSGLFDYATGAWSGENWVCSEFFISDRGTVEFQPTHWMPRGE